MTPVTIERIWPGATVVCIATGPSLTQDDVDVCRGKARVIAINNAYNGGKDGRGPKAPWADVLFACDAKWWRWEHGAPGFSGLKYAIQTMANPKTSPFADVQLIRHFGPGGLSLDPTGLKTGSDSGYLAIGLAVLFGAARIVLLGYDMQRGPKGQQHCHEPHPDRSQPPFLDCLKAYQTVVEPLKQAGVTVVNATRQTALTCFPRQTIDQALSSLEAVA